MIWSFSKNDSNYLTLFVRNMVIWLVINYVQDTAFIFVNRAVGEWIAPVKLHYYFIKLLTLVWVWTKIDRLFSILSSNKGGLRLYYLSLVIFWDIRAGNCSFIALISPKLPMIDLVFAILSSVSLTKTYCLKSLV